MKQSSTEYADSLIEKYSKLLPYYSSKDDMSRIIQFAIKDLESTIEALYRVGFYKTQSE